MFTSYVHHIFDMHNYYDLIKLPNFILDHIIYNNIKYNQLNKCMRINIRLENIGKHNNEKNIAHSIGIVWK